MSTSISYQTIESRLPELAETTTAQELGYDLLRIFNAMSETRINRIKEGKDNLSKDPNTFVVKKLLAYTHCSTENLVECLEALKQNDKITKTARLLVVSDGETLLGYDTVEEESYENTVNRLRYDYQFLMPLAGVERYHAPEEKEADVKAAYKMARIFDEIRRYNEIDYSDTSAIHALNVFMSRLLFCFFAEDTGIFPDKIFTSTLNDFTLTDGSDLSTIISEAFDVMSTNVAAFRATKPAHISRFPYVNGGLFAEHYDVPALSWKARRLLLECGDLNWAEINPDIFGSMIQVVISPELRSSLGSHYTSVSNIMKLIQPLFLDEIYAEFADGRTNEKRLRQLLARMGRIKFMDPACGSGNFLIITYKELRKLELLIWEQIASLNHGLTEIPFSNISLTQFYGIELDEFAHETATLSLWLAEHQMNRLFENRFQTHVDALPLRPSGHIVNGNACRLDWNTICPHTPDEEVYIMGNPPYLGSSKLDNSQQGDRTFAIGRIQNYKKIDYIGIWFIKGTRYIECTNARCAFVSTNSVCQGEMVEPLWNPILGLNVLIGFAHLSFKWSNNAKQNAAVFCVIIGLINKEKRKKSILYEGLSKQEVSNINPYLVVGENLIVKKHTRCLSNFPKIIMGCKPTDGGNLLLSQSEKNDLIAQYPHSNLFIKKLFSSADFINGLVRYCLWITDEEREEAEKIPMIKQRIEKTAEMRLKSPDEGARNLAQRPHQFREFNACNAETLIIPSTSSSNRQYIPMDYADDDTVVTNATYTVSDAPLWLFGILTSVMNMLWVNTIGGKLKMDYRYTSLCYNSFPFPKITEAKRTEIAQAAEDVLMARELHSEKTLAQMYDPGKMPANLREAHSKLDRVVESCYRIAPFHTNEERLEQLFALYEKMTKK